MIRRACSSARRRLNSDDSNNNTKAMRSRSQERSLQHQQEHHHQQQQHQQDRTIREESSFRGGSQASSTDAGNNSEHGSIDALIQDILLDDLSNNNNTSSIGDVEMNGARRPFPTSKSDSEVKTMADAVNRNQVIILNGSSSYKQSQQQQQQQQQQSSKTSPRNKKKSSKGVVPKSPNYYCRSQSEPMGFPGLADDNYNNKDFDNFEEEEATAAAAADVEIVAVKSLDNDIGTSSSGIRSASMSVPIPTLLRYPVSETRDLNCWSETPLNIFKVRGSNYLNDKKKVASDAYLMRARGCDLLLFPTDKQQQQQPPATVMERYVQIYISVFSVYVCLYVCVRGWVSLLYSIHTDIYAFFHVKHWLYSLNETRLLLFSVGCVCVCLQVWVYSFFRYAQPPSFFAKTLLYQLEIHGTQRNNKIMLLYADIHIHTQKHTHNYYSMA